MRRRDIASLLFAIATFPVDYLVIALLPSVSIIVVVFATVGLLGTATYLYFTGKERTEPSIVCSNCQNRFVPHVLTHPVLRVVEGHVFAKARCPRCGTQMQFETHADNSAASFLFGTDQALNRLRQINIVLPSGETVSRQVRFYSILIGIPIRSENARQLKLKYRLLNSPVSNAISELEKIPIPVNPFVTVGWKRPEAFNEKDTQHFACAITDWTSIKEPFTLTAGDTHLSLTMFGVFFTLEGGDAVYFPSRAHQAAIVMPAKFQVELYAEAEKKPETLLSRFEIDAQNWNSFPVTEIAQ
jgi:hypothetical protein